MALNFPSTPTIGDLHTEGSYVYEYDGNKWQPIRRSYVVRKQDVTPSGIDEDQIFIDLSNANFFNTTVSKTSNINFTNVPNSESNSRFFIKVNTATDYSDTNITSYDIENLMYDNITTADLSTSSTYSIKFGGPNGGDYMYILNYSTDNVVRYTLTNGNYDISNIGATETSILFGNNAFGVDQITDFYISSDGQKCFATGISTNGGRILQFNMPTPWSFSSMSHEFSYDVPSIQGFASFTFSENGEFLYAFERDDTGGNDSINQYQLNSNFDLSQGSIWIETSEIIGYDVTNTLSKIRFDPTGEYMFILDKNQNFLQQYRLTTEWDISTASLYRINKNVNSFVSDTADFAFNQDGSKLFRLEITGVVTQWSASNVSTDSVCDIIWPTNFKWEYDTTPTTPDLNKSALYEIYTLDGGSTYYGRQIINNV